MIDLTKITPEQANRIECALLALESTVIGEITGNEVLANDESLPMTTRKTLKSNVEWWKAVHALIYGESNE